MSFFKPICCDKFKQRRGNVFVYAKIRYNVHLLHEKKFTISLITKVLSFRL